MVMIRVLLQLVLRIVFSYYLLTVIFLLHIFTFLVRSLPPLYQVLLHLLAVISVRPAYIWLWWLQL